MSQYETIVVVVPSPPQETAALRRAIELARASSATLHLCVFEYDSSVDLAMSKIGEEAANRIRSDLVRERQAQLLALAANESAKGISVECDVIWSPQHHEAVIAKVLEIDAQLVIKDVVRNSSLVQRIFFHPRDWMLMRLLPCELMLVEATHVAPPKRVMAAIDVQVDQSGADNLNQRVLKSAIRLAEFLDAQLEVVAVFPFIPVHGVAFLSASTMFEEAKADHSRLFKEFMDKNKVPEENRHRLEGVPYFQLSKFALDNQIDIVVLGSAYRSRWDRLLLGSTTEALVQESAADVLLVKPHDFSVVLKEHFNLSELRARQSKFQDELPSFSRSPI